MRCYPYMMRSWIAAVLGASAAFFALSGVLLADSAPPATQPATSKVAKPGPGLGADAVVRIVMQALQQNGADDVGIETTFRFASPGNKQVTGPLEHFRKLLRMPDYLPMLNFKTVEYGKLHLDGD